MGGAHLAKDDRRDVRHICVIPGNVRFGDQVERITILNLSRYGACIIGPKLPPEGVEIVLTSAHIHVSAMIMWKSGVRCGLLLNEAIDPLDIILKSVAAVH